MLATQPCTLASTGYTALYICFNNWLQSIPTGFTALYSCFNNWLQSIPTGYTALYSCFNNWLQCTDQVLATQPWYSCFNNWLQCTDQVLATQPWYSLPDPPPPPPPPNWLQSHPTQSIQLCVDSGAGRQQVSTNMASTDWLQSLQITRPVNRLYSLIFTKTGCRVITSTIGYRACQQGTGYTTLLHQNRL